MRSIIFKILIIGIIFSITTFAQTTTKMIHHDLAGMELNIYCENPKISFLDNSVYFPGYVDESNPSSPILPSQTLFIAIPPYSKINLEGQILNKRSYNNVSIQSNPSITFSSDSLLTYVPTELDKEYFKSESFPTTDFEIIDYTWIRDFYVVAIKINTHRYYWKTQSLETADQIILKINFLQVSTFENNNSPAALFDESLKDIIINYEYASQFRSFPPVSSVSNDDWIDYSKEYVKLAIPTDGIYKITYNDLISYGINPASINPKTLKLYNKGKQIPVFVLGENDLQFDQSDYIQFWMEKNYNKADYRQIVQTGQDYINYMDRYTDTTFVWLTWDGDIGARISTHNSSSVNSSDTLTSHKVLIHRETDSRLWYYDAVSPRTQLPFWQEMKTFTWQTLGGSGTLSHTFTSPNFVPGTIVNTWTRLISYASNISSDAHKIGSSLNSTVYRDTILYNYKQTVNFKSSFSSDLLITGNNTYRLFGMPTSATVNSSLIDWIDIEYLRYNYASGDSLLITVPDTITTSSMAVRIDNVTSPDTSLILIKIHPVHRIIQNFTISNSTLTFNDTLTAGDKYLLIKNTKTKSPVFKAKKQFVNLHSTSRGADYIMISDKRLQQSCNTYRELINANYGVRTELAFVDDIYDEFNYGYLSAEAIKSFVYYTYHNWTSPKPSYITLIGDANYDYKDIWTPAPSVRKKNIVTSFGNPVSDVWYVTLDSSNINIPQMFIGRIPANTNEELLRYLSKHQNYLNKPFDIWNKSGLFFSGGDPGNISELGLIKAANDSVFNSLIKSSPNGGTGIHFYKTVNPVSNFGPYTQAQIQSAIDSGAAIISYLGHSGTQTWDNGITQVSDLKTKFSNRHPLISDFGCSTGKFAEPDVDAFGENFISGSPYGEAIAYLGNASWGYTSTSLRFPYLFYEQFYKDTVRSIGQAHTLAKIKQFNVSGINDVNRVFNYCNLLFGDPIVSLAVPSRPNLTVSSKNITIVGDQPTDQQDSVLISVKHFNLGRVLVDSFDISISNSFLDTIYFNKTIRERIPLLSSEFQFYIPIKGKIGNHTLTITLDINNTVEEIYENDNNATFSFSVFSTSLKTLEYDDYYGVKKEFLSLLNPVSPENNIINSIRLEVADNNLFTNPISFNKPFDTLITAFSLNQLSTGKRYFWRTKLDSPSKEWSQNYSFKLLGSNFSWFVDREANTQDLIANQILLDSTSNNFILSSLQNNLKLISAGSNEGKYASLQINGDEQLPNTFFWGVGTAILDTLTLRPTSFKFFYYPNPPSGDSLRVYIESLPLGTVIALTICDDGAQSVLGYSGGTPVRNAIKTLGSYYIDSVRYRESWCIIGKKGAPIGSVPEAYTKLFAGPAIIDTSKLVIADSGYVVFPVIDNSTEWLSVTKNDSLLPGTGINYYPLGIKHDNQTDTLSALTFSNNVAPLTGISAVDYPKLRLIAKFRANELKQSPNLTSLGVNFNSLPELALNYQTVGTDKDSLVQGDSIYLNYSFYNVGYVPADSFNALVYLKKGDNSIRKLSDTTIISLAENQKISKSINYKTNSEDGFGDMSFRIYLDSLNTLREFHKDNNYFEIPFRVLKDTTTPVNAATVNITFDDLEISGGELVSPKPRIRFILNYSGTFPIEDTSAVNYYLDNQRIYHTMMDSINLDTIGKKLYMTYKPVLSDGDHSIRVTGKDIIGNNNNEFEIYFSVISELKILQTYNYPNPMKDNTVFTMNLSQIPEELSIKIYTIAGRLIKDMKIPPSDLRIGFNSIPWDGRDEDGDIIANGVYLYKVILKKDGKSVSITEKIAVVK
ncbi:MAG TPA: C25 family cysteine peptidase [Ignavibacteriaceae bacterium]|nr:C25 family cysteine peptidase [Ignavibacteriaceae bacterium]